MNLSRRGRYRQWLAAQRCRLPELRTDEVSDEEVLRALRSVPRHWSGITFHASSNGTVAGQFNGATLTITKPTVSAGDILVLCIGVNEATTAGSFSTPSGWTLIGSRVTSTKVSTQVWWALQSVAALGFVFTQGTGAGDNGYVCMSFSGVHTTTPIDVTGTGGSATGAASTGNIGSATAVTTGALGVIGICDWNTGAFSNANFNDVDTSASGAVSVGMLYAKTSTNSGSNVFPTTSIADSGASSGQIISWQQFALAPAAAAASGPPLPSFPGPQQLIYQ